MKILAVILVVVILVMLSFFATMSKVNNSSEDSRVFWLRSVFFWLSALISFCLGYYIYNK